MEDQKNVYDQKYLIWLKFVFFLKKIQIQVWWNIFVGSIQENGFESILLSGISSFSPTWEIFQNFIFLSNLSNEMISKLCTKFVVRKNMKKIKRQMSFCLWKQNDTLSKVLNALNVFEIPSVSLLWGIFFQSFRSSTFYYIIFYKNVNYRLAGSLAFILCIQCLTLWNKICDKLSA